MADRHTAPDSDTLIALSTGLDFHYGDYHAVREVDLAVGRGEVYALLGTNGAGKTTTLELLQGYRRRSGGELQVLGVDPQEQPQALRQRTGVMLQEAGLFPEITVRATVELWQSLSSRHDDVERVLSQVELTQRADTAVRSLSGGERRRLDLALAIWGTPELVILDEPTTGLDPASRRALWECVQTMQEQGSTILLTTHYLEEVESLADHVAIMSQGRIAIAGTLDEVLRARPARVTADVDPEQRPAGWPPEPPRGVEVEWSQAQRPHGLRDVATLTSEDSQHALLWFLQAARDAGVTLERLRANPASLEEVFLQIRAAETGPQEMETA